MLIEAKQMAEPGLFLNGLTQPPHNVRASIAWKAAIPSEPHRYLRVLMSHDTDHPSPPDVPLLLRPKLQKNSGVDLKDITNKIMFPVNW